MTRPYECPFCGAGESVSKGVRKTKTMGIRRVRLCKACGRKFTPKNQKVGEASEPEAEQQVGPSVEPRDTVEAPHTAAGPPEPAEALAELFPPPDAQ